MSDASSAFLAGGLRGGFGDVEGGELREGRERGEQHGGCDRRAVEREPGVAREARGADGCGWGRDDFRNLLGHDAWSPSRMPPEDVTVPRSANVRRPNIGPSRRTLGCLKRLRWFRWRGPRSHA